MTDLEAIVQIGENFGKGIDDLLEKEKRMNVELSLALEKMSWIIQQQIEDIRQLTYYYGV